MEEMRRTAGPRRRTVAAQLIMGTVVFATIVVLIVLGEAIF